MDTINLNKHNGLLSVVLESRGTTTFIDLSGEWDLAGAPAFRGAVGHVFEAETECVVLDLSQLTFIDSSGLHATVDFARRSEATGSRLVIIPGPPPVHRCFEICGLTGRLPTIEPGALPERSSRVSDMGEAPALA
jgi:anti-anti-sigma factor